jgi:hypothetical protein
VETPIVLHAPRRGRSRGDDDEVDISSTWAQDAPTEVLVTAVLNRFDRQAEGLAREQETEQEPEALGLLRQNAAVVKSSRESAEKLGRALRNIEHQLELVASTFTLINTQVRTGPSEQILTDVEEVVNQSDAVTQAMQEFAPVEQALARLSRS